MLSSIIPAYAKDAKSIFESAPKKQFVTTIFLPHKFPSVNNSTLFSQGQTVGIKKENSV
jgi:hypothetical protein